VPPTLQSPELRRIIVAYTVNRLGTWFGLVALSLAVFDHTHSALAVAALLLAWQALPAFVTPAVVARVEASARRSELSALYVIEALATTALVVLLGHFWLPAVLLLVAIDGTAALAASALLRAELARAARGQIEVAPPGAAGADGRLAHEGSAARPAKPVQGSIAAEGAIAEAERKANAALNVAFSLTFVLGPALAGAVVASAGASTALLIDVVSFLICGAMLFDLHPHVEEAGGASVRARLLAAWRHINDVPVLRALLLTEAVALVFFESAAPIEVAYAKTTLNAGDRGYGFLVAAWGVGVLAGSVLFARSARRSLGAMLTGGTLAIGLAYIGFAAAPSLAVACIAAVAGGVGNGVEWASVISAVQRLTPQQLHGRLMGAVESLGALCPAIGLSLGGILVTLSSPRAAFLVVGIGATAMTIPFLGLYLKGFDRTPPDRTVAGSDAPPPPVPETVR
jgi:hypothetical protein